MFFDLSILARSRSPVRIQQPSLPGCMNVGFSNPESYKQLFVIIIAVKPTMARWIEPGLADPTLNMNQIKKINLELTWLTLLKPS